MKGKVLARLFYVLILAISVLSFSGGAFAMEISGSFQDSDLKWQLKANPGLVYPNYSFFCMDQGIDWTCEPSFLNITQTNTDSAATTGQINETNDLLTVITTNSYPGYYNSVSMRVYNSSPQPIIMPQPVLHWEGQDIPVPDGTVITLCDQVGSPVVEFRWTNNTGKTLNPGGRFEEVFEYHVLKVPEPPVINELNGLTPGYWKNWRNHYTSDQFSALLGGTIAGDIATADSIFKKYSAAPGKELSIIKAHLLACQLTLNLAKITGLPNPDGATLSDNGMVRLESGAITVGEAVNHALNILSNPSGYSRAQILEATMVLNAINNL